jgi:DNA-binding response OmpR family regulator
MKVLLVEDDTYISHVFERALKNAGHETEIKLDGESAWEALSTATMLPSVILLDLTLPKMSGTELLAKIRADKRFEHTPVAVLTNAFTAGLEKELLAAGANLYLVKVEYKPSELVNKVEELMKKFTRE